MKLSSLLAAALLLSSAAVGAQQPARPAITGIAFMRVYTTDAAAAQRFYGQTLGFARQEIDGLWVYPVNKLQWLEVIPHPGPEANHRMAAVAFTTRDAAGLEQYLAAHGVTAEQPLKDGEFGVRDPEGNLVIFVQSEAVRAGGKDAPGTVARLVAEAPASPNATSHRIIHVGFIVHDPEKENAFWRKLLGFRPYWHGGFQEGVTNWMSLQVPDGSDWIEYMLRIQEPVDLRQSGMQDHFSLGETKMSDALVALEKNGCEGANCTKTQIGRDGKVQLNLFDPDQTRVEFMEFKPSQTPCCSAFTAEHPTATENH
jgi:catechol 2,3-dioxygenase-like lactoylglutathione lyase family enzyme